MNNRNRSKCAVGKAFFYQCSLTRHTGTFLKNETKKLFYYIGSLNGAASSSLDRSAVKIKSLSLLLWTVSKKNDLGTHPDIKMRKILSIDNPARSDLSLTKWK